ncbi:MAG: hypothetical protein JXA11_16560 [Phycisphaerae bacterium]|nr:hypothetical protein [Phycisphaerae bacterium]
MADDLHHDEEEWVTLDAEDEPQPVPVSPPGQGPQPVPVPVPPPKPKVIEDDEPIALVDFDDGETPAETSSTGMKKRVAGAAARGLTHKADFKREMNLTGKGATRVRMFYSKIADGPLLHLESMINDWIDEEGIEVKHIAQVIGTLEGKRAEPNLIITVWY